MLDPDEFLLGLVLLGSLPLIGFCLGRLTARPPPPERAP